MTPASQALNAVQPHDRTAMYRRTFLHEWFELQAISTPQRRAVGFGRRWLTYRELDEASTCLAWWLRQRGIGPEVVVGLCLDRSIEMIVGLLGVLKAGGAYLPMDPTLPRARLDFMVEDAGAALVLADKETAALFSAPVQRLDEPGSTMSTARDRSPVSNLTADNLAYVMYTSGSTGVPKGVMMTHRGIQRLAADLHVAVIGENSYPSVVTLNAPIFFDGSIKQLCWLAGGASMIIVPDAARQDPELLLELLTAHHVELMDCTPTLLEMVSLVTGIDQLPPGLRLLIGGEVVGEKLWNAIADAPLEAYNLYGPTECNAVTVMPIASRAMPAIGRPLPGYDVRIVDESGTSVPPGTKGELVVCGAGIARGYHNRARLTAERFTAAPFATDGRRAYRTGDVCRLRSDGTFEFIGRRDGQVKLRGYRIELGEVEAALLRRPEVVAGAVVLRETRAGDKILVGYYVSADGVPDADVMADLRAELPAYMVPTRLVRLDRLPMTRNGKVDRAALPQAGPDGG